MNERIKELMKQADYPAPEIAKRAQKLVELIVQECADIAYEYDIPNLTGPGEFIGNRMKKHFGVEE